MWRKLLLSLVLLLWVDGAQAEPSIQAYFSELDAYSFSMQSEIDSPGDDTRLKPFSAPILVEAGFQGFSAWEVRAGGGRLRLDVFQMQDPLGAYELFTLWPDLAPASDLVKIETPTGALFSPSEAIFWRGYYFCHVRPRAGSRLTEEIITEIIGDFVEVIETENLLPVSVSHLPGEQLVPGSTRFYLGAEALSLNEHFPEPLLKEIGLEDRIEIAFTQYEPGNHSLFLVGYPTPALAEDYFVRLQNRLQSFFSAEGVYLKRAGVVICIFIGPEERAREVLSKVEYTPTIKWLYEKKRDPSAENLSFLGLITQTFFGIGVFLLLILGTGLVTGLVRYEALQRFPQLTRRKEMVRLGLDDR
ncbi:MAG TPA: DUF6599 family protein [Acidobacteriota bacterium]|nr:DUF6599 family protein [Acidobacteriota bacterium]